MSEIQQKYDSNPPKWDKILTSKNEASRFLKIYLPVSLLFSVGTSPDVLYNKIHNAVSEFLTFSQQHLLTLNFSITFFMIFSRLSSSVGNDQILARGNVIKRVATTKYLGFLIDENLSWKNHSNAIAEKLSRGLGVLQRIKNLVPKKIYFSMFSPYFSYGCSIWASNFVTCFKRVQKIQNKIIIGIL